jgi:plastocyanin
MLIVLFLALCKINFATVVMLNVEDYEFNPTVVTVNVGDTIIWMWDEGVHTTTSTLIPAGAAAWNAPIDQVNAMFTYVVTEPGSYDYQCIYHSAMGMVGHFTAIDPTSVPALTSNGSGLSYNFTAENLNFTFTKPGVWQFNVYDINGRLAKTFSYESTGISASEFSVADLSQGVYIVRMYDGKEEISGKLIRE